MLHGNSVKAREIADDIIEDLTDDCVPSSVVSHITLAHKAILFMKFVAEAGSKNIRLPIDLGTAQYVHDNCKSYKIEYFVRLLR